ncbi:MAG TPA: hypothetical protein VGE23_00160, partial [Candidatus Paceibacterota bacterium]
MDYTHRQLSMNMKKVGRSATGAQKKEKTYPRPAWVEDSAEEELCPDCFKVVGSKSRYQLVCFLGKAKEGLTVSELT